jgi:hypothetical protein
VTAGDPERDRVVIGRRELGYLLAASQAVLERLTRTNPKARRLWELARAVEAAEQALLGQNAEPPGREHLPGGSGRARGAS